MAKAKKKVAKKSKKNVSTKKIAKKTAPKKVLKKATKKTTTKTSKKKAVAKKTSKKVAKTPAKKATKKSKSASPVQRKVQSIARKTTTAKSPRSVTPSKKTPSKSVKSAASQKKLVSASAWTDFFTPLDDRLLVRLSGESDRTPGGLYIPATVTSQRPQRGQVLVVGRGRKDKKGRLRPMDVGAGDEILFGQYSGSEMELQGERVLILREEDVLGVVS